MSKKLIILTLCCNQQIFIDQENRLRKTLYAKDILNNEFENVDYWTYTASTDGKYHVNKKLHKLEVPSGDDLSSTYDKTYMCFNLLLKAGIEFDYVLMTNCSTYVNVPLLKQFVDRLTNETDVYTGAVYCTKNISGPYEYCLYGVGNSLLLSKYWVTNIADNHVNKYKHMNTVVTKGADYYTIADCALGFVINCYCMEHNIDMYDIWKDFKFPMIGEIPADPYNYMVIPFRVYKTDKDGNRDIKTEIILSITIHNSIKEYCKNNEMKLETSKPLFNQTFHIIDFEKGMHSIVTREFGNEFLRVMSLPKYIMHLKEINKIKD